ncbi:MAG: nitronate monooxygenase, partial [Erythrobacter sp.]|nr:nitronate monooxygenase [Erythrobacter sp.]
EMDETQTQLIFRSYRNTARVYRNSISEKVAQIEAAGGGFEEVHEYVSGANQEKAWSTGDIEAGMVTAGLSGTFVRDVPTCQEVIDRIMADAKAILTERVAAMFA